MNRTDPPALSAENLMLWTDTTSQRWRALVERSPGLLTVPCDVRESRTVADLLMHIGAVELRYAERLSGLPETSYEALPNLGVESIFAPHDRAMTLLRDVLAREEYDWAEVFSFATRSAGMLRASRQDVFLHALLHGIRHYAQLATLARQAGFAPDWPMDYLFLHAGKA